MAKRKIQRPLLLHEEIRNYIKEEILSGDLKPGDQLVETRLAQELEVSQAPVREAIRELVFCGLLEQKPYSGTYVKKIQVSDMRQFYVVRAALEKLGAESASETMTEEQYQELATEIFSMEEAARVGNINAYIRSDERFHDLIIAAANNELLTRLWELCNIRSWLYVGTELTGRNLLELASRHRKIFEAIRSRDLSQARGSIDEHLNDLLKMMAENDLTLPDAENG